MSPILTVILAQLFSRKGEKLGKLVYIGAVVAIAGVVLVVLNGTLSFHLSPLGTCWPGRRPDVGGILHPGEEIYRAV